MTTRIQKKVKMTSSASKPASRRFVFLIKEHAYHSTSLSLVLVEEKAMWNGKHLHCFCLRQGKQKSCKECAEIKNTVLTELINCLAIQSVRKTGIRWEKWYENCFAEVE